jgi:hypothetical protein
MIEWSPHFVPISAFSVLCFSNYQRTKYTAQKDPMFLRKRQKSVNYSDWYRLFEVRKPLSCGQVVVARVIPQ